ncbi:MAG: hypothetical protein Q8R37_02900 [Nanoarchaeota archaeon]|nr:hypothetical protein [Nanoarchaeota archaeon]
MHSSETLKNIALLFTESTSIPVVDAKGKNLAYVWPIGPFKEAQIENNKYYLDYHVQFGSEPDYNAADVGKSFYPLDVTRPLQPQLDNLCTQIRESLDYCQRGLPPDSYLDSPYSTPDSELERFD